MSGAAPDQEATAQANELYWRSEFSVNQIAEQMDLSKGALYGMIEPLPVGLECSVCGTELVYGTRTAQERGRASCPGCGWDGEENEADPIGADAPVTLPLELEPALRAPPAIAVDRARDRILIGGALLGAAAGLALVLWARRR
jgi:hypothetical protein